jgi:DNA-binding NarL/FixJ family response regulator
LTQIERPPFYYLDNSLNVLVVDDDAGVRSLITGVLESVRLYCIKTASCAAEAQKILKSSGRIHLCVFDLGLSDVGNDEYHLLRTYGARVPFVIFTGCSSPARGFAARELGARDILEKSPDFKTAEFLKKINRHVLANTVNPAMNSLNDTISASVKALFDYSPETVSQWAQNLGITDRELRHIWRTRLGANAKIILSIYQIYSSAFLWYERTEAGKIGRLSVSAGYSRLEDYYHMHRSTINDYMAFGNIAAVLSKPD